MVWGKAWKKGIRDCEKQRNELPVHTEQTRELYVKSEKKAGKSNIGEIHAAFSFPSDTVFTVLLLNYTPIRHMIM